MSVRRSSRVSKDHRRRFVVLRLLKADADGPGWSDAEIAEAFNCRVQTIENLRKRLVTESFELALDGKKRQEPPTPCKLDGEAEAKLIAMRLGKPPAGYGHWTLQLLDRRDGSLGSGQLDQSRDGPQDAKKNNGPTGGSRCQDSRVTSCPGLSARGIHQDLEVGTMPYRWPGCNSPTGELDVLDRNCSVCRRRMYICDHRYRRFHTLEGPVGTRQAQSLSRSPFSRAYQDQEPEIEASIAPPIGPSAGTSCWIGHRRCSRHWAIPRSKPSCLTPTNSMSDDTIGHIHRYQVMLAARQQDPVALLRQYHAVNEIILSIDGLRPKGHDTFYVVRED